ncbi:hypothetical protein IJH24_01545 [Candidatus Saccharibacteria bacterium]|nr:hypothetical protein [Candidatus Saccharibacteria bacterium]
MKRFKIFYWILFVVLAVVIVLNRQVIIDFVRGGFYKPTAEMEQIRYDLNLTSKGELIFNASKPELSTREDFNEKCRAEDEVSAILGCYTEQAIYVYNIDDKELDGILELTTAHELLHAVYERMNVWERDGLKDLLEKVYAENREALGEEVNLYDSVEQLEEIYVRAGTEIKKLPEELEKHYAGIFKDQDKVVSFYDKYIKVFREIEDEFEFLEKEMNELNVEIDTKTADYEDGVTVLNKDIDEFNNCANTMGCFNSDYEFYVRRNELVSRQTELQTLYDEIDELINQYNSDVEKYNKNVIRNDNLQNMINSYERVEEL